MLESFVFDIIKKEIFSNERIEILTKDISDILQSKKIKQKEELEYYKKEIEKLQTMTIKLLEKNLEGNIDNDIFYIKNKELKEQIQVLQSKLYSIKNISETDENRIKEYLFKLKENSDDITKRKVIEVFVKEIRISNDKIKIVLRKFPKDLDVDMVNGGDDESRTRVRNHNSHKLLQV